MKTINKTADYEAKIQLIQMGIRPYNDVVFSAPSFTENCNHIVTAIDGVATYCDCKGFHYYHKACCHMLAVERYIAEEQRNAAEQAVKTAEAVVSETGKVDDQGGVDPQDARYFTKEEMQQRREASRLCKEAGYQFRLLGRWHWTAQYRKDGGEWQIIPGAQENDYEDHAEKAIVEFKMLLASQIRQEREKSICRGYLTRPAGVRRDEKYGIILR